MLAKSLLSILLFGLLTLASYQGDDEQTLQDADGDGMERLRPK